MLLIKEKLNITYKLKTFKDGEPKEYLYWFNAMFSPKHHYSPTISAREVIFVVKAPGGIDKAYALIKPFTLLVWFIIVLSLFLLTPIIKGILKAGEKLSKKPTPNLLKIFWFLLRCILMQHESVSRFPGCAPKVVLILWIVATFILTSSYGGAILSYLSIPGSKSVISTYAQLARAIQKGTYTCGTVQTYSIRDIIMNSNGELEQIFRESMLSVEENIVQNQMDAIENVLKRNYAFFSYDTYIKPIIMELGEEKFSISKDSLLTSYSACIFHNNFPFRKEFQNLMTRIQQTGIIPKFYEDEFYRIKTKREKFDHEIDFEPLNLYTLKAPFLILSIGYGISILTLIAEITFKRIKKFTHV
ncbi:glutamate receptor 3.1-like [Centruroides sculpturatus]|uniref:glutamate receptor 3.1-like n=1 Tax=Centruroides sculpturatus TaxID=218467 RepID=UPI000C6CE967|nr:glutamate receptor 3.1-like [Centruroides sculpturatus]